MGCRVCLRCIGRLAGSVGTHRLEGVWVEGGDIGSLLKSVGVFWQLGEHHEGVMGEGVSGVYWEAGRECRYSGARRVYVALGSIGGLQGCVGVLEESEKHQGV